MPMKGRVAKEKLGGILLHAMCASKNIRVQRDRLQQFKLQLLLIRPGCERDADAPTEEVVDGLIRVYCEGLEAGARDLTACVTITAQSRVPPSLPLDFAVLSDDRLFRRLLALRLPRRPVTQAQAFARLEAAFYAVHLTLKYCLTRCIGHLGHPKHVDVDEVDDESFHGSLPDTDDQYLQQDDGELGLQDPVNAVADTESLHYGSEVGLPDPVAAATEDLANINLSAPDAAATDEPSQDDDSEIGLPDTDTGETPQAAIIDMERARTYLDGACTLADLALKHVDLAVTAISSCLDPGQVASISAFADARAYTK